jgi:hypothetical protein
MIRFLLRLLENGVGGEISPFPPLFSFLFAPGSFVIPLSFLPICATHFPLSRRTPSLSAPPLLSRLRRTIFSFAPPISLICTALFPRLRRSSCLFAPHILLIRAAHFPHLRRASFMISPFWVRITFLDCI